MAVSNLRSLDAREPEIVPEGDSSSIPRERAIRMLSGLREAGSDLYETNRDRQIRMFMFKESFQGLKKNLIAIKMIIKNVLPTPPVEMSFLTDGISSRISESTIPFGPLGSVK